MIVGTMKDKNLKLRGLHVSHTLGYSGGGPEHLKIETRLIDEMFASVMGEYVFLK